MQEQAQNVFVPTDAVQEQFKLLKKAADEILHRARSLRGKPNLTRDDLQLRAVGTYADLSASPPNAILEPTVEWYSFAESLLLGPSPQAIARELASFAVVRCPPGGRKWRLGSFSDTMIRAEGTDATGTGPTLAPAVTLLPNKELRTFWECTEGELLEMRDDWSFDSYENDDLAWIMNPTQAVFQAFRLGSMDSQLNLFWAGSIAGGLDGLNHYDGIVKILQDSTTASKVNMTGVTDTYTLLEYVLNNHPTADFHNRDDAVCHLTAALERAFRTKAVSDTTDQRGYYDRETGETGWMNMKVVGQRKLPSRTIIAGLRPNIAMGVLRQSFPIRVSSDNRKGTVQMTAKMPSDAGVAYEAGMMILQDNGAWGAVLP